MEELKVLRTAGLKVCSTTRNVGSTSARPGCKHCDGCTRDTAPQVQSSLKSAQGTAGEDSIKIMRSRGLL